MIVKEQEIPGVFEFTLIPNIDNRGFFMRTYDSELFDNIGIGMKWVQENHSRSDRKGIIRGLHFQIEPFSETKLIRCIRGAIFDIAVDIRTKSSTFGKWVGLELSEQNRKMLYIPRGFAHGYCTLTEICEVVYKVDNFYSPKHERGIIWNDRDLAISWPITNPILSEKDSKNMNLAEYKNILG
jgi:dTDP-4-dehydrorhamnose 3,5-epimerase